MELTILPPDLQAMVEQRLATGAYADAEDVLRRALEAQAVEDALSDEDRRAISARLDDAFDQAARGQTIGADQAWREIEAVKQKWLAQRAAE